MMQLLIYTIVTLFEGRHEGAALPYDIHFTAGVCTHAKMKAV